MTEHKTTEVKHPTLSATKTVKDPKPWLDAGWVRVTKKEAEAAEKSEATGSRQSSK